MNLTLSCLVIFLAFAMTCLTGPVEGRPHSLHEHDRPRSSRSNSGSGSDSSGDESASDEFDPCAATPCKNNGTCNATGNDYQCACAENYFGKNCEGSCQPGWVPNDGKCYFFSQDVLQWEAARNACVSLSMNNGHLVEINGLDEQNFLNSQVKTDQKISWIGLNDRETEGLYTWTGTQNSVSFTWIFFVALESSTYDCVSFYYYGIQDGKWYTTSCDNFRYYICEMKPDYN